MSPADSSSAEDADGVDESSVARFLETHPDFFAQRDSLLMSMRLPQPRGDAVSLMDRQVALLRERNVENRRLIETFKRNALRNESIFHTAKSLVLSMIASDDEAALYAALSVGLRDELGFNVAILFTGDTDVPINDLASRCQLEDMPGFYASHFDNQDTYMGPLRDEERSWLFPGLGDDSPGPSSAAIVVLQRNPLTLLALGHPEPGYFSNQLDTTLLSLITDVLAMLLPRYSRAE